MHFGHFLNGLAGPVAMAVGPSFSSIWFPANQRTIATATMSAANYLGVAASFIAGPKIVPPGNYTDEERYKQLDIYMWAQTAIAAYALLSIIVYFPNGPKHRPSVSAGHERTSFLEGWKQLFKHKNFWLVGGSYGLVTGVYAGWSAVLAPNLKADYGNKAEDKAAWIGFYSTVAGCIGGVGLGLITDVFGGKMRSIIILLTLFAFVAFTWFSLQCDPSLDEFPLDDASAFSANILGGLFINGAIPLYYESAVEATFPIDEASTTGLLTTLNNVGCLLFLIPPMFPKLGEKFIAITSKLTMSTGHSWLNWALVGACFLALILLQFYREKTNRKSIDLNAKVPAVNA